MKKKGKRGLALLPNSPLHSVLPPLPPLFSPFSPTLMLANVYRVDAICSPPPSLLTYFRRRFILVAMSHIYIGDGLGLVLSRGEF